MWEAASLQVPVTYSMTLSPGIHTLLKVTPGEWAGAGGPFCGSRY